jgi:hypothetical protein
MTTFGALEYDPEVFKIERFTGSPNSGRNSPLSYRIMEDSSYGGSPRSNARSYGGYSNIG